MSQKEISMPFRYLFDHDLTDKIPYNAVIKELPALKGLLKERGYNNWTNINSTSYDTEPRYKDLNHVIEMFL